MITFTEITKEDRDSICKAALSLETGNHLLRKLPSEEITWINTLLYAIHSCENGTPTKKQKEIVEWYKVCSDYEYAKENGYLNSNYFN